MSLPIVLGICQAVTGPAPGSCDIHTDWSITKTASTELLANPKQTSLDYVIRVVEGDTRFALELASELTFTGLVPEGTRVLAISVGLQKAHGDEAAFTTIATGEAGMPDALCDCPVVASSAGGELAVTLAADGAEVARGEPIVDHLAYGDRVAVEVATRYDLGTGLIQPGDRVRLRACVAFVPEGVDDDACHDDGGEVRTTRACSAFDLGALVPAAATSVEVTDLMSDVDVPWLVLGDFTATSTSSNVSPRGPVPVRPDEATSFTVKATGVPGTASEIHVFGNLSCAATVSCGEDVCATTLENEAFLMSLSDLASVAVTCDACTPPDPPPPPCGCPDDPDDPDDPGPPAGGDGDRDDDGILDRDEDADHDGEVDANETDPDLVDTDGDGLCDGRARIAPCVGVEDDDGDRDPFDRGRTEPSPVDPDSDDDGICDGEWAGGECKGGELAQHTDPLDSDTDDDGLCDGPGGDAWDDSGCLGSEVGADGLMQAHDTDPADPDTDHGGVSDGVEVLAQETDPLDPCDGDLLVCAHDPDEDPEDPDQHGSHDPDEGSQDPDAESDPPFRWQSPLAPVEPAEAPSIDEAPHALRVEGGGCAGSEAALGSAFLAIALIVIATRRVRR